MIVAFNFGCVTYKHFIFRILDEKDESHSYIVSGCLIVILLSVDASCRFQVKGPLVSVLFHSAFEEKVRQSFLHHPTGTCVRTYVRAYLLFIVFPSFPHSDST